MRRPPGLPSLRGRRWLPQRTSMRVLLSAGAVAVVAVVAVMTVWFTPALSVRHIEVRGMDQVPEAEIVGALGVDDGTPLMQVDTRAAAQGVAGIARVARVSVHRDFPSTLDVDVTERTPVAYVDADDGPHLIDEDAVDFAQADPPPGLPQIVMDDPADTGLERSVLGMVVDLPEQLRGRIARITVASPADVSFGLDDGRTLRWGSVDRSGLKARVALAVLEQPGETVDVSSPNLPTTG